MQSYVSDKTDKGRTVLKLSVLCALSVLGCTLLGYFILPFAAAYYATILISERGTRRIATYVVPIIMFTVNFFLRGFYSLEAIAYIAVALVIYFCFTKGVSKGETVFYTTLCVALLILASAVLLSFELTKSAELLSVKQFYMNLYNSYRAFFVDTVSSLTQTTNDGKVFFLFNTYEVEEMFRMLVMSIVPLFFISSFAVSGLTLKCFCRNVRNLPAEEYEVDDWRLKVPSIVSYFFIATVILSLMMGASDGIFGYTLMTVHSIFTALFLYMGFRYFYGFFLSRGRSAFFATVICIVVFVLLSSYSVSIFSYLGVICCLVSAGKAKKENKS